MIETSLFTEDIPKKGVTDGHIQFTLATASEDDLALVGVCANVAGSILFEKLGAQGTNIVMQLTASGGTIDIVARGENDGLNMIWTPQQRTDEQLEVVREQIRTKTMQLESKPTSEVVDTPDDDEEDENDEQLMKHLTRIP